MKKAYIILYKIFNKKYKKCFVTLTLIRTLKHVFFVISLFDLILIEDNVTDGEYTSSYSQTDKYDGATECLDVIMIT